MAVLEQEVCVVVTKPCGSVGQCKCVVDGRVAWLVEWCKCVASTGVTLVLDG